MTNPITQGLVTLLTGAALAVATSASASEDTPLELIEAFMESNPRVIAEKNGCTTYFNEFNDFPLQLPPPEGSDDEFLTARVERLLFTDCGAPGLSGGDSYQYSLNLLVGEDPDSYLTYNVSENVLASGGILSSHDAIKGDITGSIFLWSQSMQRGEQVERSLDSEGYDTGRLFARAIIKVVSIKIAEEERVFNEAEERYGARDNPLQKFNKFFVDYTFVDDNSVEFRSIGECIDKERNFGVTYVSDSVHVKVKDSNNDGRFDEVRIRNCHDEVAVISRDDSQEQYIQDFFGFVDQLYADSQSMLRFDIKTVDRVVATYPINEFLDPILRQHVDDYVTF